MTGRTLEEIEARKSMLPVHLQHMEDLGEVFDLLDDAIEIAQELRAERDALRKELDEANECRDPAYFAQLGKR